MLSSDHDGEVLSAARRATEMLGSAGVTWQEVLDGGVELRMVEPWQPARPTEPWYAGYADEPEDEPSDIATHQTWAESILAAGKYTKCLNEWDCKFLHSLSGWDKPLSDKQKAVLRRLHAKVIRAGATEMGDMPI